MADHEDYDPSSGLSLPMHMVAGSFAGLMEHALMFPVDTAKTHMQVQRGGPAPTLTQVFQTLVKAEGFGRMWRGIQSVVIGVVPAHAAYFSIYEVTRNQMGHDGSSHRPLTSALSGALSVMVHDAIMTPLDVCKQRLQLGYYSGLLNSISSIASREGMRAFFVSYPTTLVMNVPHHGVMVAANESLRLLFKGEGENTTASFFFSGAFAGALAAVITNPLDVAKTRLQTQALNLHCSGFEQGSRSPSPSIPFSDLRLSKPKSTASPIFSSRASLSTIHTQAPRTTESYKGLFDALKHIYAEEGVRGLMRGSIPRLVVHAPSAAISWTAYELAKDFLLKSTSSS